MASLCRTKKGRFLSSKTAKRLKNLPVPNTRYSSTSNEGSSATVSGPQQELHSRGNPGSVNAPEDCFVMEGRRVVEISHLASQLQCNAWDDSLIGIKMPSSQKAHCGHKTFLSLSYRNNGVYW